MGSSFFTWMIVLIIAGLVLRPIARGFREDRERKEQAERDQVQKDLLSEVQELRKENSELKSGTRTP